MKNKCPSWRGKATVRPRRQGRRCLAFTGAKRKPLTEEADGSGAGFSQEGSCGKEITQEEERERKSFDSGSLRSRDNAEDAFSVAENLKKIWKQRNKEDRHTTWRITWTSIECSTGCTGAAQIDCVAFFIRKRARSALSPNGIASGDCRNSKGLFPGVLRKSWQKRNSTGPWLSENPGTPEDGDGKRSSRNFESGHGGRFPGSAGRFMSFGGNASAAMSDGRAAEVRGRVNISREGGSLERLESTSTLHCSGEVRRGWNVWRYTTSGRPRTK